MAQFLSNELLQNILKNEFQNMKFLHSCLLVNKIWSLNVVPILWTHPFHLLDYNKKYSHHIISTYYSCWNKQAKYNYNCFLRSLLFFSFLISFQEWRQLNLHDNNLGDLQIDKEILLLFASSTSGLFTLDLEFEIEWLDKLSNVNLNLNTMIANLFKDTKLRE